MTSKLLGKQMADGTFAALMFVAGLIDMGANYCGTETGCLGRNDTQPRLAFSSGSIIPRRATSGDELFIRYDLGHKRGPFGNAVGFSIGENGDMWLGFGQTYTFEFANSPFFAELHAIPGLYAPNGGFDLGGPLEFRSGFEFGYENRAGWRFGVSYDHRSNAGIFRHNPGVETMQFRVSVPLK